LQTQNQFSRGLTALRDTHLPDGARVVAYAGALGALASASLLSLVLTGFPLSQQSNAWPLLAFIILALLVEHQSVRLSDTLEISVAFLPLVFVAVAFGPLAAGLVGAATMLAEFKRPYLRWMVWTSNRMLLGVAGGLAAELAFLVEDHPVMRVVLATAAATCANFFFDLVLTSLTLKVRGTGRVRDVLKATAPIAVAGVPIYTAVAGLLAYAYIEVTPWSAALFFIPALAAQRLFVLSREQRDALRGLAAANERLERANLSFAAALVAAIDARDRYTAGHSAAVAVYAQDIAVRLGLSDQEVQLTYLCGLVHDIGKIGLPPGLLEKPGALTLDERRQMEEHSAIGERILAKVDDYGEIAKIVRHHHERIDGCGYPDGLKGEEIPLVSRIIGVADAYDAMTSDRPYRDAMPSRVARMRLAQAVGSQFDTSVTAAFEAILAEATEAYRLGGKRLSDSVIESSQAAAAAHAS
jgi:putative nucleotidyltransferase with HDIG domain